LTQIFETYLRQAGRIAVLDFHTGLGAWGYGEQIVNVRKDATEIARARTWYGAAVTSPVEGNSSSARVAGGMLGALNDIVPHAEVTGMALEIGTLPMMEVLQALRADAWLHAHGDPESPEGKAIKAQMRTAFYGDTDDWKGMVAGQALLAFRQALAGLQQ
jgi:hypothetical protein